MFGGLAFDGRWFDAQLRSRVAIRSGGELADEASELALTLERRSSGLRGILLSVSDSVLSVALAITMVDKGFDVVVTSPHRLRQVLTAVEQFGASRDQMLDIDHRDLVMRVLPFEHDSRNDGEPGRLIFPTSGSTGDPKLVPFRLPQIDFLIKAIASCLGYRADDALLSPFPVTFDYGFYQILLALNAGMRIDTVEGLLSPNLILKRLAENEFTLLPVTPSLARRLIIASVQANLQFPSVRLITSTGAPFDQQLQIRLHELCPSAVILPMYGLTECKRVSIADTALSLRDPTSVGYALPETSVSIVSESGQPAPLGESGEAVIRGPHVAHGYYGSEGDLTLRPLDGEWVLHTGDRLRADASGALHFEGRIHKDFVKLLDERVSLIQMEALLRAQPGVHDVAVSPVVDAEGLVSSLVAEIVAGEAIDEGSLHRLIRQRISPVAASATIFRATELLPLSDHGKVDR